MVRGYREQEFKKLIREGVALGNRRVGLMSENAKLDLNRLTDAKIDSLYSDLHDVGTNAEPVAGRS